MMKTIYTKILKSNLTPFLFMGMLALSFVSPKATDEPGVSKLAVSINRHQISKQHKIRLYPGEAARSVLFTVDGLEGQHYQLFVFDLDGKLVGHSVIHNREIKSLNEVLPGTYEYEVLQDDEKIENGQLTVTQPH